MERNDCQPACPSMRCPGVDSCYHRPWEGEESLPLQPDDLAILIGREYACVFLNFVLPPLPSARSTRHASENLNFREAVVIYQGLCYESMKKLKPMASAGADADARVVSASAPPSLSSSKAPIDGGVQNDSEGGRRGTAQESGGGATTAVAPCGSSPSSCTAAVAAAAAAARDIVNRFVKEGAPEQVNDVDGLWFTLVNIVGRPVVF